MDTAFKPRTGLSEEKKKKLSRTISAARGVKLEPMKAFQVAHRLAALSSDSHTDLERRRAP